MQEILVVGENQIFNWNGLSVDLKKLLMHYFRISALLALSHTDHATFDLVKQHLEALSATQILQRLIMLSVESSHEEVMREILQFQKLIRRCGFADRWHQFNTMESGLLALMTIPRESLNDKELDLKKLAYGCWRAENRDDALLPSDYLNAEIVRLGVDNINRIVNKLEKDNRIDNGTEWSIYSNYGCLKILAVMILRSTNDIVLQEFILELFCTNWGSLAVPLLMMFKYAQYHQNQSLMKIIAWLVETDEINVEAKLQKLAEQLQNPKKTYILHRLCCLLAKPGCFDQPFCLKNQSIDYNKFQGFEASWNTISMDYPIWFWVFFSRSWSRGVDLAYSLIARQNCTLNFEYSWFKNVLLSRHYASIFGNYARSAIVPPSLATQDFHYSDFYQANFTINHDSYSYNDYPSLSFDSCMMDEVRLPIRCNAFLFNNIYVRTLYASDCRFFENKFNRVSFAKSTFDRSSFVGCIFVDCHFSENVSFKGCKFFFGAVPLISSPERLLENSAVLFANCQFNAQLFLDIYHPENVILLNCQIANADRLPKGIRVYHIPPFDKLSAHSAFELFQVFCKDKQSYMIAYLQQGIISQLAKESAVITREDDRLYRLIFNYQPTIAQRFLNTISGGRSAIPRVMAQYNELRLVVAEDNEPNPRGCFARIKSSNN